MATCLPLRKEVARAMPFPIGIAQLMVVVFAMEDSGQT